MVRDERSPRRPWKISTADSREEDLQEEQEAPAKGGRARQPQGADNGINEGARRRWGGERGGLLLFPDDRRLAVTAAGGGAEGRRQEVAVEGVALTAWILGAGFRFGCFERVLLRAPRESRKRDILFMFVFCCVIAVYVDLSRRVCFNSLRLLLRLSRVAIDCCVAAVYRTDRGFGEAGL